MKTTMVPPQTWNRGDRVWLDGWLPHGVKAAGVVNADEAKRLYSPGFVGVLIERQVVQVPKARLEPRRELVPGDLYTFPAGGGRSTQMMSELLEIQPGTRRAKVPGRRFVPLSCGRLHPQPHCVCAWCGFARAWGVTIDRDGEVVK